MDKGGVSVKRNNLNMKNINMALFMDWKIVVISIIGFLLSRSIIIESLAPLGIALFIVVSKLNKYKVSVFLSVLVGILTTGLGMATMVKYTICLAIFMLMSNILKKVDSNLKLATLAALIILPISMGQVLLSDAYLYDAIIYLIEALILFISIYIFTYGVDLILNINNRSIIRAEESISISFILIFSIMGIGDASIFSVSIRSVLASMVILISAISAGAVAGSTSGVIVGVAFLINNVSSAVYMGVYSFAGLISGGFSKLNKYVCTISYILSWVIIYAYTNGINSNLTQIREILIASLIVLLLPKKLFSKVESIFKTNVESNAIVYDYIKRSKDITNNKLINMYKAYDELADIFDKIREKEKVIDNRDVASIVDMIHKDQCRTCSMRRRCWEVKFNHTYKLMYDILDLLEEQGEVNINNVSEEFKKECISPDEIIKVSNYYYKMFLLDYNWSVKFSESRKLIANQIRNISKSIESLSKELEGNVMLDLDKEKNIYDELQRYNIPVNRVTYLTRGKDDFEIIIEKKTCKNGLMCEEKIIDVISNLMDEKISAQKIGCRSLGGGCKIQLTKAQKYKAITEISKMSRDGYVVCGDNYTYMEINDGKYMVAISDGMGKGKKAYEESSITIDILEKMMDAKVDEETVINTINNMLLLKSEEEEMFSTLDLGIIDLKKGSLETIKMGACSTYIKKNENDIDLISSSSLPVGILSEIKLDRKSIKIEKGDLIIMVSDGILDAGKNNKMGDNWLIYFLQKISSTNPKEISNLILDRALELQNGIVEDDMTVLVTKICNG